MKIEDNLHIIKEFQKGHFLIYLDFASPTILKYLLHDDYKYVWVHANELSVGNWTKQNLPIADTGENHNVLAKNIKYDAIFSTEEFKKIDCKWQGIQVIQMNKIPPNYLDLDRIEGKTRYDLLNKECDYLFELNIPFPIDYGELVSPNKEYLEALLKNPEINWNDLP